MKCPFCNLPEKSGAAKCACGFPSAGTPEEKKAFLSTKMIVLRNEVDQSERHLQSARYMIWGVAGLALINAVILFAGPAESIYAVIPLVIGLIFVGLGVLFYKNPVVICTVAVVLGFFVFSVSVASLVVLLVLGVGLYFAIQARNSARKQDALKRLTDTL
ncbi:MAG: hypothetical protein LUD76_10640 [Alistipes sp.]|nr:hypothetical protein [Alistipes sp.]